MAKAPRKTTTKNVLTMPKPASKAATTNPTITDIATRAFELYCERGRQDGHDVQDWIQAERELRQTVNSTAA
jgi:hypothetical protein